MAQNSKELAWLQGIKQHTREQFSLGSASWNLALHTQLHRHGQGLARASGKEQNHSLVLVLHELNCNVTLHLHIFLCLPALPNEVVTSVSSSDGHHLFKKASEHLPHRCHDFGTTYSNFNFYNPVYIMIQNILYNCTCLQTYIQTHICLYLFVGVHFNLSTAWHEKIYMEKGKHFSTEKILRKISAHIKNIWTFTVKNISKQKNKINFCKDSCLDFGTPFLKMGQLF